MSTPIQPQPPFDRVAIERLVAEVVRRIRSQAPQATAPVAGPRPTTGAAQAPVSTATAAVTLTERVVTQAILERLPAGTQRVALVANAVITPSARDHAREAGIDLVFSAGRGLFAPPRLPEPIRIALEAAFTAIFADPAWAQAAARAGLPLHPLVGAAYREAALGGEAALQALWQRHPWKE